MWNFEKKWKNDKMREKIKKMKFKKEMNKKEKNDALGSLSIQWSQVPFQFDGHCDEISKLFKYTLYMFSYVKFHGKSKFELKTTNW